MREDKIVSCSAGFPGSLCLFLALPVDRNLSEDSHSGSTCSSPEERPAQGVEKEKRADGLAKRSSLKSKRELHAGCQSTGMGIRIGNLLDVGP